MSANLREELLSEIRWLSDIDRVRSEWTGPEKPAGAAGVGAEEYYSILFDDLKILSIGARKDFTDNEKTIILEFARSLQLSAKKDHLLHNAEKLLQDPHFRISQSIASLV